MENIESCVDETCSDQNRLHWLFQLSENWLQRYLPAVGSGQLADVAQGLAIHMATVMGRENAIQELIRQLVSTNNSLNTGAGIIADYMNYVACLLAAGFIGRRFWKHLSRFWNMEHKDVDKEELEKLKFNGELAQKRNELQEKADDLEDMSNEDTNSGGGVALAMMGAAVLSMPIVYKVLSKDKPKQTRRYPGKSKLKRRRRQ